MIVENKPKAIIICPFPGVGRRRLYDDQTKHNLLITEVGFNKAPVGQRFDEKLIDDCVSKIELNLRVAMFNLIVIPPSITITNCLKKRNIMYDIIIPSRKDFYINMGNNIYEFERNKVSDILLNTEYYDFMYETMSNDSYANIITLEDGQYLSSLVQLYKNKLKELKGDN